MDKQATVGILCALLGIAAGWTFRDAQTYKFSDLSMGHIILQGCYSDGKTWKPRGDNTCWMADKPQDSLQFSSGSCRVGEYIALDATGGYSCVDSVSKERAAMCPGPFSGRCAADLKSR